MAWLKSLINVIYFEHTYSKSCQQRTESCQIRCHGIQHWFSSSDVENQNWSVFLDSPSQALGHWKPTLFGLWEENKRLVTVNFEMISDWCTMRRTHTFEEHHSALWVFISCVDFFGSSWPEACKKDLFRWGALRIAIPEEPENAQNITILYVHKMYSETRCVSILQSLNSIWY